LRAFGRIEITMRIHPHRPLYPDAAAQPKPPVDLCELQLVFGDTENLPATDPNGPALDVRLVRDFTGQYSTVFFRSPFAKG
jgi:hypothetical protein